MKNTDVTMRSNRRNSERTKLIREVLESYNRLRCQKPDLCISEIYVAVAEEKRLRYHQVQYIVNLARKEGKEETL